MQATSNVPTIHPPDHYDWSEFQRRPKGFITDWCGEHGFKRKTLYAIVNGDYRGGAGPKIKEIIRVALAEKLIEEIPLKEAA